MKKIGVFFVVVFLFVNLVYAQQNTLYNSQNLIINIDVSSKALIKPTSSDYEVKYITINLSHFPYESFNQEVIDFETNPEAKIENNFLFFRWENPKDSVNFGYNAKIRTNSNIVKIGKKIPFPLRNLPDEVKQFTEPSDIIDSEDEEIIRLASELAEGEDDLYVIVHKIAEWTNDNVEYDLSTLTVDVNQKASWVLENRQGVCDELTSLFIAMLRSLGIPGKFVSGISYTNSSLFPEQWGSHGWAEVYFPGYGWVPYDVTYEEFGYIDPTHVKLKECLDSNQSSVQYKWAARNTEIETEKIDIDTSLEKMYGEVKKPVTLDVNILKQNIGFGSYNLIEVVLENTEDYYVSSSIYISRPKEVEIVDGISRTVLLKPNEKKSVFWIVKLTENLEDNFIYTFPVVISTLRGSTKSTSFKSSKGQIVYSFDEIKNILEQKEEEEEKVYSKDVSIDCSIDKKEFYTYEKALIECNIKNTGNIFLENLNSCFDDRCIKIDLGITQEKRLTFPIENYEEGNRESVLSLKNEDVSKAGYIQYNVLDKPEIKIKYIESPSNVEYEDNFKVAFLLSKESSSIPQNLEIKLIQDKFEKTWTVKELTEDRRFLIDIFGRDLKKGFNEFNLIVSYQDKNGRAYETQETFFVELLNVTLLQNILLVANDMLRHVEHISLQPWFLVVLGIPFLFFIILWFVFRKKK